MTTGRFRLPVRWSSGTTNVHASHGSEARAIEVKLPDALALTHQITLT